MDTCVIENEYVSTEELAQFLGIAPKTIRNNSYKINGRCKIGGAVRYHLPTIRYTLQKGQNLFRGDS